MKTVPIRPMLRFFYMKHVDLCANPWHWQTSLKIKSKNMAVY